MLTRRYLEQKLKMHHLRAVEAIILHRSLLKGAAALGITQPALTKTLQELEDILQQRLFDRLPRGVRPTEAGDLFAQFSRRLLAEIRRLDEELDRLSGPEGGTVAIGTLPVAATGVLPGALTRLKQQHPQLRVRLEQGRTEDLLPKLASGEIDLIVGRLYEPSIPDGFLREPLWEEPISVLARLDHPVFRLPEITMAALRPYDLVLPTVTQRVGQEIEVFLERLALAPTSSLRSSSYGFIREMLHGTDMLSIMPRLMMAGDLLRGTLKVVPLPEKAPPRPAGIILPPNRVLPAPAHAFLAALRAHVAEIGERGLTSITTSNSSAAESDRTRSRRRR
ncbi:LysR family transcriptional regulator [Roseomonas sp. SSH11]|uniref:LysR family transcriptional regulator n=1 Tax=Pararoseomonas baculiformis TaxID=2820812 RepID=A0ABS4AL40_9PROT|nr:LysR substrate-binding domain-containing protein [Pararoseomonas baculiformis]MBP0447596.1 LysR family transcriptional regulator [Pararoseomonas baculiformis]